MDETKAVITLTKAALEFIYSDRSIDEAWSDYEESALELYDNESDQSADEFLDQARLIFHDSVDARLKELKKHSRFTDNAVAKPEKTPIEHSQTGAEIAAAVIAVMVSNPDNSVDGYIKLFGEALPKIKAAIQQSATGSKILPDPLLALTRLKPEHFATGLKIAADTAQEQNETDIKKLHDAPIEHSATGSEKVLVAA
jgi:hypothetical protein